MWYDTPRQKRFTVFDRTQWLDHDADGLLDLAWFQDGGGSRDGKVWMIYGTEDEVLDTAHIVELDFGSVEGKYALFSDVTGDQVPELLLNSGGPGEVRVYVGFKGQRLLEQYGSGDDPARPGEDEWWGRPWAKVPLPGALHDGWASNGRHPIYADGDVDFDGINDIMALSAPDVVIYKTGNVLDSLYDAWFGPVGGCTLSDGATFHNNLDGTGRALYAVGGTCDGRKTIVYRSGSHDVPQTGRYRELPPGTGKPDTDVPDRPQANGTTGFHLHVQPNPATGIVTIRWDRQTESGAEVSVTDVLGRTVITTGFDDETTEWEWDASGTFGGRYFITVSVGDRSETTAVTIHR
jgi:hypothetical protein